MVHHRLRRAGLAALVGAVMIPASAQAASQTVSDASGDGGANDVREAGWDVDASNVTFRLAVPHGTWTGGYNARALAFIDTNADGRSDYAVQAFSGTNTAMTLYRTPQSTATCQKAGTGATSVRTGSVAVVQDGTLARISWTFPAADIGGASAFRWAVYGLTWSMFNNGFDYLPNAANPDPSRPNPVTTVNDVCTDGTGPYQPTDLPLVMANGIAFPDGGSGTGTGTGGGDGGSGPTTTTGTAPSAHGTSFVGTMPKLTGMRVDAAKRALEAAGIAFTSVKTQWVKKAKGAGAGDVVKQTPATGAAVQGALRTPAAITLAVKAATRTKNGKGCDNRAFLRDVKGAELPLARDLLAQAGCKAKLNFSPGANEDMLARSLRANGRQVAVQVSCPRAPEEQDLFAFFREMPTGLSFGAGDWALTVSDGTRNNVAMSVLQRGAYIKDGRIGGQFVQNAKVFVDGSDVGVQDRYDLTTDATGTAIISMKARKAGKIDICMVGEAANGKTIYGSAQLRAIQRPEGKFFTVGGRELVRIKNAGWSETKVPESQYVRESADFFGPLVSAIQQLLSGFTGKVATVFNAPAASQDKLRTATHKLGFSPGQIAFGQTVGPTTAVVRTGKVTGLAGQATTNLLSDKGLGVVPADGGNVIAAGGANLIGDNGSALVGQAGSNYGIPTGNGGGLAGSVNLKTGSIVDLGGHNVISDNGLGVIAAGGANAICAGGYN